MSSSTAFYQIFFQGETLFQLSNPVETVAAPAKSVETPLVENVPAQAVVAPAPPVKVAPSVPIPASQPPVTFPALNHKILILTDDAKSKNLIDSEALLLNNILKAVGHSLEKTDVMNFSFLPGTDARQVLYEKRTHFFITFGVPLIKLHLDLLLVPYAPKQVEGIWFLLADPLVVIDADKAIKKKLWLALQKMFETA
jgi:hypothetical protein